MKAQYHQLSRAFLRFKAQKISERTLYKQSQHTLHICLFPHGGVHLRVGSDPAHHVSHVRELRLRHCKGRAKIGFKSAHMRERGNEHMCETVRAFVNKFTERGNGTRVGHSDSVVDTIVTKYNLTDARMYAYREMKPPSLSVLQLCTCTVQACWHPKSRH